MPPRFAILVPAFNGGKLLERTLRSCMAARLDPRQVQVLVRDNGSTDGSYETARALADESGGLLSVGRNAENLGRIGNWNRCVELAEHAGAQFATFLMVGDEWLPGADPLGVSFEMERAGARVAFAPYHIVDEAGRFVRLGRNYIRRTRKVVPAQPFIDRALQAGALCFGPLQANVYRLDAPRSLRFCADDPTHTDQWSTILYLGKDARSLLMWERPLVAWKAHAGRFHMKMNVTQRESHNLRMIRDLAAGRDVAIDWRIVNTNLFLVIARELIGEPGGFSKIGEAARHYRNSPGGLSMPFALKQVFRRVALGRSLA